MSVRAAGQTVGRLLAGPGRARHEYVLCPLDRFWFRPSYTSGKCPLCGEFAPGGAPPLPAFLRIDSSGLAMGLALLVSLGMALLVLLMYYKA